MKFKLLTLCSICFAFYHCTNKSQPEISNDSQITSSNTILDIKNDSLNIQIKEVLRSDFTSFTNSYHNTPFLGVRAECISLKELIGIVKRVENNLIIDNKDFENQYYAALINQYITDATQDSIIRNSIVNALGYDLEKSVVNIDTSIISVTDRMKYLQYANNVISDTIVSQYQISPELIEFENMELDKIMTYLSEVYDKVLILESKESQRINYKIKRMDWSSMKEKLEAELGLSFTTSFTRKEEYRIKSKSKIQI